MINQHIKNMSLTDQMLFAGETRFVMWSSSSGDTNRNSHAQLVCVPSSARVRAEEVPKRFALQRVLMDAMTSWLGLPGLCVYRAGPHTVPKMMGATCCSSGKFY